MCISDLSDLRRYASNLLVYPGAISATTIDVCELLLLSLLVLFIQLELLLKLVLSSILLLSSVTDSVGSLMLMIGSR